MERCTKGVLVGCSAAFTLGLVVGFAGIDSPFHEGHVALAPTVVALPVTLAFGVLLGQVEAPDLGRRTRRLAFAVVAMLAAAIWLPLWPAVAAPALAVAALHGLLLARWTESPRRLPAMWALVAGRLVDEPDPASVPMTAATKGALVGFASLLVVAAVMAIEPHGDHPLLAVMDDGRGGYSLRFLGCLLELLPGWLGFGLLFGLAVHHVGRVSRVLGAVVTVLVASVAALCFAYDVFVLGAGLAFVVGYLAWANQTIDDRYLTARSEPAPTAHRAAGP